MDQLLSKLKNANPWLHFTLVAVAGFLLVLVALQACMESRRINQNTEARADALEKRNTLRNAKLSQTRSKVAELSPIADQMLKGIASADRGEPDLNPLEQKIQIRHLAALEDEGKSRFTFRSNAVEYHALVPALAAQEKATPLMRCSRLILLTTAQRPFSTAAIPLQMDMELVFPRE
jgi:hypothetical protein